MAWDFDFDEEDSFVQGNFMADPFGNDFDFNSEFADPFQSDEPQFNQQPQIIFPQKRGETKQYQPRPQQRQTVDDGNKLIEENNRLRESALSLKKRFAAAASTNQTLRNQLEECRSRFKNCFTGLYNSKK
ncbi:hypothetical protein GPJ56_010036 [Histomonas meleagridis]|uniref:uncharacterized protein n=1 Tax=Histomonas meleagridis TaxID=135588 RepID=UPI003559C1BF|nr:hypothetical protein GPJ56_010036 [Histomonas meleagridis]KAH0799513.1 hypothetical protein GO595_007708 [Histomonas meleagridis]